MTRYVDLTETYLIHEKMLAVGGGRAGIRDFSLLHSAVELPKVTFGGKLLYETVWKQAASLIHSLIKNHPFNDGNKRTGFFTSLRFLNLNGYEIQCSKKEVLKFCIEVDTKNLSLVKIADWFREHALIKQ